MQKPIIRKQSPIRLRTVSKIPKVFQPTALAKKSVVASRASMQTKVCMARRKYKGDMMKAIAAQVKRSGSGHSLERWRSKRANNRKVGC